MTVLLVRHARAGRRDRWRGDDRLRPLTKRGRVQAHALVELLAPWPEATLLSSPWVRCVQTVEPLAQARRVDVKIEDALGEGMGPKAWELLTGLVDGDGDDHRGVRALAVLCTHGDVIEEIHGRLAATGCRLDGPPHAAKGSVWVIEDLTLARYLPPPL